MVAKLTKNKKVSTIQCTRARGLIISRSMILLLSLPQAIGGQRWWYYHLIGGLFITLQLSQGIPEHEQVLNLFSLLNFSKVKVFSKPHTYSPNVQRWSCHIPFVLRWGWALDEPLVVGGGMSVLGLIPGSFDLALEMYPTWLKAKIIEYWR